MWAIDIYGGRPDFTFHKTRTIFLGRQTGFLFYFLFISFLFILRGSGIIMMG